MSSDPEKNISHWLDGLGLGEYADAFASHHITLETLREMTDADLKDCGVAALGHRKVLLKAIGELGEIPPPAEPAEAPSPHQPAPRAPQPPPLSTSAAQAQAPADSTAVAPSRRRFWTKILASKFLVVSIVVHLIFGLGATYFIVQRYSASRKLTFRGGAPTVNPAKRALEHQVSVAKKKAGGAPPQAKRISTSGLAKIVLPDMPMMTTSTHVVPGMMSGIGGVGTGHGLGNGAGMGSGGAGGGGGGGISMFGLRGGAGLVGTFYDLKQTPSKKPTKMGVIPGEGLNVTGPESMHYKEAVKRMAHSWSEGTLAEYYRAPAKLSTTQIFIPQISADEAPKAFGVEKDCVGRRWLIHYEGFVVPPRDGTFRFIGSGDDILVVRWGERNVLDGSLVLYRPDPGANEADNVGPAPVTPLVAGKWITMRKGEPVKMQVLIGECPGGQFSSFLLIEEKGHEYKPGAYAPFQLKQGKIPDGPRPQFTDPIVFGSQSSGSALDALRH